MGVVVGIVHGRFGFDEFVEGDAGEGLVGGGFGFLEAAETPGGGDDLVDEV